jgi:hypothetical protein
MLIWVIGGAATASGTQDDCQYLSAETCNAASDIGTAIGVAALIALWAAGDLILGVIWLATNGLKRPCPACGTRVSNGLLICDRCGHDFVARRPAGAGWPNGWSGP